MFAEVTLLGGSLQVILLALLAAAAIHLFLKRRAPRRLLNPPFGPPPAEPAVTSLAAAWMGKGSVHQGMPAAIRARAAARAADGADPSRPDSAAPPPRPVVAPGPDPAALLRQGQEAAYAGDRATAYRLFVRALNLDSSNEDAWLWVAGTTDDRDEAIRCLQIVLARHPDSQRARDGLDALNQAER